MITHEHVEVFWSFPDKVFVVALCQVRWEEMRAIQKKIPDLEGIPAYWSMDPEGEVHWYPHSRVGMPSVRRGWSR